MSVSLTVPRLCPVLTFRARHHYPGSAIPGPAILTSRRHPQETGVSSTAAWPPKRRTLMSWTSCRPPCGRGASPHSPSRSASSRCRRSVVSMCFRRPTGELSCVGAIDAPTAAACCRGGRGGGAARSATAQALPSDGAHQDPANPTLHLLLRVRSRQQVIDRRPAAHSAPGGRARN